MADHSTRYEACRQTLHRIWGYEDFRPGQDRAIEAVCKGEKTLCIFPTGAGKSLCYQVPAVSFEGLCLVISPLVALMEDQVKQLQSRGVSATFINSSLSFKEAEQRWVNARNGMYDLLYCAPERLATDRVQQELAHLPIWLIAIDEAHCISEWGHEFRPAYREIARYLVEHCPSAQWIALTATATPQVRKDICEVLAFDEPTEIALPFTRDNLKWWVLHTEQMVERMMSSIVKVRDEGDGLIYAGTRFNSEQWAKRLQDRGITAAAYHAGISSEERSRIQQGWISGDIPWVAATNAFGMGIDKPNCRYVFHEGPPSSLEAYYQEAGRAGRDGHSSFPVLFYNAHHLQKAYEQLEDQYPSKEVLQRYYDWLCDALTLAVGSKMEEKVALPLDALVQRSGESAHRWRNLLDRFNQWGIIEARERRERALILQFRYPAETMSGIIDQIQDLDKQLLVDRIFRSYGLPSYHERVVIPWSETQIWFKGLHAYEASMLESYLDILMQEDGWLRYEIVESEYQIFLTDARQKTIPLDFSWLKTREKHAREKLNWMALYAETKLCRELFLRNYFGEDAHTPCGHCDNCEALSRANESIASLSDVQFVMDIIEQGRINYSALRKRIEWPKDKLDDAIRWLLHHRMIEEVPEELLSYQKKE